MDKTIILLSMCLFPNMAFAYIDPGTGAYFVQSLLAFVGAAVFYITRPAQLIKAIVERWRVLVKWLSGGNS